MEDRSDEIRRLQGCINDLVSLLALPALWRGRGPPQVVDTLLDALLSMLRLDFAYVRLNLPACGSPVEAVRLQSAQSRYQSRSRLAGHSNRG